MALRFTFCVLRSPTSTENTMNPDLRPGSPFPDFELPDHSGRPVRLSEHMDGWPAAVVFVRGHY
jgi:hypothetical protein